MNQLKIVGSELELAKVLKSYDDEWSSLDRPSPNDINLDRNLEYIQKNLSDYIDATVTLKNKVEDKVEVVRIHLGKEYMVEHPGTAWVFIRNALLHAGQSKILSECREVYPNPKIPRDKIVEYLNDYLVWFTISKLQSLNTEHFLKAHEARFRARNQRAVPND